MNPGQFRHKITLMKLATTQDEIGNTIEEWQPVRACWAAIKTVNGREYFAAASVQAERTYRFIIRYTPGINETMKIDFQGRLFDIQSVLNDDEGKKTLTIIATERVAADGEYSN
ncbi:head closure protein [Geobacillus phage vB_GthS_PT9.1]|nr:head closure protein [Geobacillus phage vB_GthS_PT9.1]